MNLQYFYPKVKLNHFNEGFYFFTIFKTRHEFLRIFAGFRMKKIFISYFFTWICFDFLKNARTGLGVTSAIICNAYVVYLQTIYLLLMSSEHKGILSFHKKKEFFFAKLLELWLGNFQKSVWKNGNNKRHTFLYLYVRFQNGRPKSRYLLLSNQTIKFFNERNSIVQLF